MSYTKTKKARAFTLTQSDLDSLKAALEFVLGDDLKPTHRLEIFSRLAGHNTFAALKAGIGNQNIFGDPIAIPILPDPIRGDAFLASLPVEIRRRLTRQEDIGILKMVACAMEAVRDNVFGDIGYLPEDRDAIEEQARNMEIVDPSNDVLWGSLPAGPLLIVASPDNTASLLAAHVEIKKGESRDGLKDRITPICEKAWHLAPARLDYDACFFDAPETDHVVSIEKWDDTEQGNRVNEFVTTV